MNLGWYVFIHRPAGGVLPIAGFWRKRTALLWAQEHADPDHRLEVNRFSWWSEGIVGRQTALPRQGQPPAVSDLNQFAGMSRRGYRARLHRAAVLDRMHVGSRGCRRR